MENQLKVSAYLCKVGVETIVWKEIEITSINLAANFHENQFFQKDHQHLFLPKILLVMMNKSTDMEVHFRKLYPVYKG